MLVGFVSDVSVSTSAPMDSGVVVEDCEDNVVKACAAAVVDMLRIVSVGSTELIEDLTT
jgi:hypothetical protein